MLLIIAAVLIAFYAGGVLAVLAALHDQCEADDETIPNGFVAIGWPVALVAVMWTWIAARFAKK